MLNEFRTRYEVYTALVNYVEQVVAKTQCPPFFSQYFEKAEVLRRCKQALLSLIMSDFIKLYLQDKDRFELRTPTYSVVGDEVSFTLFEKIKIFLKLVGGNLLVFQCILRNIISRSHKTKNAVVLHCYGRESLYEGINRHSAVEFLSQGPFDFINTSDLFIGVNRPIVSDEFNYPQSKYPLLDLLKATELSLADAVMFFFHSITNLVCFAWYSIKQPIFLLLYSDFLWLPTVRLLNNKGSLKHYAFDNSDFSKQILPIVSLKERHFTSHMIFYASNTKGFKFKGVDEVAEHPHYQYMKVDKAWVWNDDHKRWLENICRHVQMAGAIGPILFYNDNRKAKDLGKSFKIVCFDVTPASDYWRRAYAGGGSIGFDFYSPEHMLKFVKDIESSTRELNSEIQVLIKPKRMPSKKWHDEKYVNFLQSCRNIQILDSEVNIFELVRGSDLILAIPFTSALFIADQLGVPGIFYDPTAALEFNLDGRRNIEFVQSRDLLKRRIEFYFSQRNVQVQ